MTRSALGQAVLAMGRGVALCSNRFDRQNRVSPRPLAAPLCTRVSPDGTVGDKGHRKRRLKCKRRSESFRSLLEAEKF